MQYNILYRNYTTDDSKYQTYKFMLGNLLLCHIHLSYMSRTPVIHIFYICSAGVEDTHKASIEYKCVLLVWNMCNTPNTPHM